MERSASKKRKAVTRDVDNDPALVSGDEFEFGQLDGTLSDSEDEASQDGVESDGSGADSQLDLSDYTSASEDGDIGLIKKRSINATAPRTVDAATGNLYIDEEDAEERPNYRIEKDANGNERYIYDEIDPGDDSDYSVPEAEANTIGDIPLSFYDSFPHIGYNINGKKIMRPAAGEALDALLDSIDIPKGYTGLVDPSTGKPLELSQDELKLLRQVQQNEIPVADYDPYEPTVEWFTSKTEIMPLSAAPEPKRRFVPSKHEQKRIMKIVKAIREGRIQPYRPQEEKEEEEEENIATFDIWQDEQPRPDHAMHMPAPKLPPPGFDESYHPPPEYLPDKKEKKAWEEADEEDREKSYLPTDHTSLRKVPGYDRFVKEKFDRCLDLYLAPRVRRSKLDIDPESLLPKLPNPDDLRPFPTKEESVFRVPKGRVRSVAIDPSGRYLATGGDDGVARVWYIDDTKPPWEAPLKSDAAVNMVRWRPGKEALILAVAAGESIFLCAPNLDKEADSASQSESEAILNAGWGHAANEVTNRKSVGIVWTRPDSSLRKRGVSIEIVCKHTPKTLSFHAAGNHLVSIQPSPTTPASHAIQIHTLSKHLTQLPFKKRLKGGGTPQTAHFHPSRPLLFVANQRVIRAYDLTRQTLVKIIQPGARWISSFSIHPTSTSVSGSDNLIVGSYDRRLLWMDIDMSPHPYKTLRYHSKAIRQVMFHHNVNRYPLFADASDDGTIQIFHGMVTGDVMSNATIVPLKVLKGHRIVGTDGLGVLDLDWHPTQPWLVSAGGDGTARLWK